MYLINRYCYNQVSETIWLTTKVTRFVYHIAMYSSLHVISIRPPNIRMFGRTFHCCFTKLIWRRCSVLVKDRRTRSFVFFLLFFLFLIRNVFKGVFELKCGIRIRIQLRVQPLGRGWKQRGV